MFAAWFVRANRFVRHVADAAFDAVVDADLAHGAECFVVKSGDTQRGSQFFVKLSQIFEMSRKRGQLHAIVGQEKFLVAGVPKTGEPPLQHDRGHDRHLVEVVRAFAELRAATVLFHAHDASRAADGKTEGRQAFDLLPCKSLFDIPHGALSLVNAESSVKRADFPDADADLKRDGLEHSTERAGTLKTFLPG